MVADNPIGLIYQRVNEAPAPFSNTVRESIPAKLETIVRRCLDLSPENRYQTMEELAQDLKELVEHGDSADILKVVQAVQASIKALLELIEDLDGQ